ncbi:MAG: hypothetical protein ABI231_04780 [Candidatus Tumulicola sp.]
MTTNRCLTLFLLLAVFGLPVAGCSRGPSPSHLGGGGYRGKLSDDTLVEASTTVLVTNRDVVIALDCAPLRQALTNDDTARIDQAVADGTAVRLPAGVTIYTPPFSAGNPGASPLVVTDDKYAGRLCTPNSYDVAK